MQPFVKWAEKIGDMKKMLLKNKLGFKNFFNFLKGHIWDFINSGDLTNYFLAWKACTSDVGVVQKMMRPQINQSCFKTAVGE